MTAAAGAIPWHGQAGSVLLGPTQDRVARYLAERTRHGQVAIRSPELAATLGLGRSELFRITARLRVLGLFGIANDRSGAKGGRRYWRTAIARPGVELEPIRHRQAWARIVAWARRRRALIAARLAELRDHTSREADKPGVTAPADDPSATSADGGGSPRTPLSAGGFEQAMRRHGLGRLIDEWKAEPREDRPQ